MDAKTAVSVILGNDSDSDWNVSDEEREMTSKKILSGWISFDGAR